MKWPVRIVVLLGLAALGWELHVRQAALVAVAADIDARRDAIDRAETGIDEVDRDIEAAADQIRLLDARITEIEQRHPGGVPRSEYAGYRRLVAERNAVARRRNDRLAARRALIDVYEGNVAAHNARVEEASALARRAAPGAVLRDVWDRLRGAD
jgi:hypothetical protein